MEEQLYDEYKKTYNDSVHSNLIVVPNDTKYNELWAYLNQELEKEQARVLKKV